MQRIDLDALRKAATGDEESKVSVKRKWLMAVYCTINEIIAERDRLQKEVALLTARVEEDRPRSNPFGDPVENLIDGVAGIFKGKWK